MAHSSELYGGHALLHAFVSFISTVSFLPCFLQALGARASMVPSSRSVGRLCCDAMQVVVLGVGVASASYSTPCFSKCHIESRGGCHRVQQAGALCGCVCCCVQYARMHRVPDDFCAMLWWHHGNIHKSSDVPVHLAVNAPHRPPLLAELQHSAAGCPPLSMCNKITRL